MAKKFRNKYRIDSARLRNWDYATQAAYFITICTHDRIHYFGTVENNRMILSPIGKIAHAEWTKSPIIRPDMNIHLGEFIIMPDHMHGIIIIGDNQYNTGRNDITDGDDGNGRDDNNDNNIHDNHHGVSMKYNNKFGPQRKNLASIIRGYKSSVTINARKINPDFGWQTRFYDHVIRDDVSFDRITQYIKNNPKNWGK